MPSYSDQVLDHFMNPRNVGEIEGADGVGEVGNPVCGDMMRFSIKVEDGKIADVKYKTFGCGAAIAVSSMVSELAMGRTLEEAKQLTREKVAEELGGLPPNKMHCSNLGAEALLEAITDYEKKQQEAPAQGESKCKCPFCEEFFKDALGDQCSGCGANITFCEECGEPLPQGAKECPTCAETEQVAA
jgi:nitrogen fixation protein NifU and related proteins